MKDIGLKQPAAAREVAGILDKRKVRLGQANKQTPTWRQVIGIRNEIIGERCPPEQVRLFRFLTDGLRRDLDGIHPDGRRDALIHTSDQSLTRYFGKNRNSPSSNPEMTDG